MTNKGGKLNVTETIVYYRVTYRFRNTDTCFRTAKEARDYVEDLRATYVALHHRNDPWGYRPIFRKRKGA